MPVSPFQTCRTLPKLAFQLPLHQVCRPRHKVKRASTPYRNGLVTRSPAYGCKALCATKPTRLALLSQVPVVTDRVCPMVRYLMETDLKWENHIGTKSLCWANWSDPCGSVSPSACCNQRIRSLVFARFLRVASSSCNR